MCAATVLEPSADLLLHSRFFDHLVELISAKFYHTDDAEPPVNLKYLKKQARVQEKEARKQQGKANKRAKLNPDTAHTALDVQRAQHTANAPARPGNGEASGRDANEGLEGRQPGKVLSMGLKTGPSAPMEELKAKLHKRLEGLREQRKAEERKKQAQEAAEWRKKSIGQSARPSKQVTAKRKAEGPPASNGNAPAKATAQQPADSMAGKLSYGMLDFGEDGRHDKKRRKLSKAELLQEAERKAAERQTLAGSNEGKEKLHREAWGSALARAQGERILDDPKLLRKSLKKEKKQKEKKGQVWKERTKRQRDEVKAKQNKRQDNLQARVQAKQEKKIDKREKKLMRAGFEGRRDTFIGKKK